MVKKIIYTVIILLVLVLGYYIFHKQVPGYSVSNDTLIATPTPTPTIVLRNDNQ